MLGTSATGSFNADGLSETVGLLTLSATSVIDMGAGASLLHFSDSNLATWTGTLSIWNWSGLPVSGGGTDRIFFGDGTGTGLTASQLLQVSFYSDAGSTLFSSPTGFVGSSGEIVPVPEPSSVATVLGLLGLVGWRERRKGQAARRMERCR